MKNEDLRSLVDEEEMAFRSRDYERCFQLAQRLIVEKKLVGFFRCALILENGLLTNGKDLDGADKIYWQLIQRFDFAEGYLGRARITLAKNDISNRETALRYCREVTDGDLKHRRWKQFAYLLEGRIYEELFDPPDYERAARSYRMSIFSGSALSLRLYARSLMHSGRFLSGILMHVIATVSWPFFVAIFGVRATRYG